MRIRRGLLTILAAVAATVVSVLPAGGADALSPAAGPAGLTWSAPVSVDGTNHINGVSCPSASLCVAVDGEGNVLTSSSPAGGVGAWSVSSIPGVFGLESISCATATMCVAQDGSGDVVTSTDPAGGGATWTKANLTGGAGRTQISCPSTSLCVASFDDQIFNGSQFVADVWVSTDPTGGAGKWERVELEDPGNAISSVSCATSTLCFALDSEGNRLATSEPTGAPSAWHAAAVDPGNAIYASSCPSASLCVAGDLAGNVIASGEPAGSAGAWHASHVDGGLSLFGISCPTSGLCVAVDDQGNALASTEPTGSAAGWGVSEIDPKNALNSVSCPTVELCVAVDEVGNILTGARAGGGGKGGGGGGSSGGGGAPSSPIARLAPVAPPAGSSPGDVWLSAGGSTTPLSDPVRSYTYKLGADGEPITCPAPDPVLDAVLATSAPTTATVTVTTASGATSTTSTSVASSLGALPRLHVGSGFARLASAHASSARGRSAAGRTLTSAGELTAECLSSPVEPSPGSSKSIKGVVLGETAPTSEGVRVPPCMDSVTAGIINGLGCFTKVDAEHPLPTAEAEMLCKHLVVGCKLKSKLSKAPPLIFDTGSAASARISSSVAEYGFDAIYFSKEPIRVDGVEIDPVNGGAIVLARAGLVSSGFLKRDAAYLLSSDAVVKVAGIPVSLHVPNYLGTYEEASKAVECGKTAAGSFKAGELGGADCLGSLKVPSLSEAERLIPSTDGPFDVPVSPENLGILLGEFSIPSGALPIPAIPELPLSGSVKVNLTGPESASLAVHVVLPGVLSDSSGHGLTGDTTLELNNKHGLNLNFLHIHVPSLAQLGLSRLKNLDFLYSRPNALIEGSGTLDLNDTIKGEINLGLAFEHGSFKHAHADYTAPPGGGYPLFGPIFLTYVGADVGINPTKFTGVANLSVGPAVVAKCGALGVQGTLTLVFGNPFTIDEVGNTQVLCANLGYSQNFHADSDGHLAYGVGLEYNVPGLGGVSGKIGGQAYLNTSENLYEAQIDGEVGAHFKVQKCVGSDPFEVCSPTVEFEERAGATISIGDRDGHAVGGAGVCVHYKFPIVGGFDIGAGITDLPGAISSLAGGDFGAVASRFKIMLSDCSLSPFRLLPPPAGVARVRAHGAEATPYTVHVAPGSGNEVIGLEGQGGAPQVELSGPGGVRMAATQEGINVTSHGVYVRQPSSGQTIIELPPSASGAWTLQPTPGSAALKSVAVARQLPAPKIAARVSGRGLHRLLRYSVRPQPGLKVEFVEGVDRGISPIGTAKGAQGRMRFSPSLGSTRARTVIAEIFRNGQLAESRVVGRFAPGRIVPGRPGRVRATRVHGGWRISFRPGANTTEHLLTVRFADGAQALLEAPKGRRSVTVPASFDASRLTAVQVVGLRGSVRGRPAVLLARIKRHRR